MGRTNVVELSRYPLGADLSSSATSLTVGTLVSGVAVSANSVPFYAVLDDDTVNEESVLVTAISGATWTVIRGQESTSGVAHSAGASVVMGRTEGETQRAFGSGVDSFQVPLWLAGGQSTGAKASPIWNAPFPCRLAAAICSTNTAPAGSAFLLSLQKNGSDCLTGVTIADGATSGTWKDAGAGTAFAQGDKLKLNIAQVGSGTAGSDLSVTVVFERT